MCTLSCYIYEIYLHIVYHQRTRIWVTRISAFVPTDALGLRPYPVIMEMSYEDFQECSFKTILPIEDSVLDHIKKSSTQNLMLYTE